MAPAGPAGLAGQVELAGHVAPLLVCPTPAGVAVGMDADKPIDSGAQAEMVDNVAKTAGGGTQIVRPRTHKTCERTIEEAEG